MRKFLILNFALLFAIPPIQAASQGKNSKEKKMDATYVGYRLEPAHFQCDIPRNWAQRRDEREDERSKVYGVYLTGPRSAEEQPASISLQYFSAGNTQFTDMEDYLKAQSGKPQPVNLAGLKGRRLSRDTSMILPPGSMDAKEVPFREEQIVLGHERGFFVMTYLSPRKNFQRRRFLFQKVLDTFKPL